jgi:hypothetical protein
MAPDVVFPKGSGAVEAAGWHLTRNCHQISIQRKNKWARNMRIDLGCRSALQRGKQCSDSDKGVRAWRSAAKSKYFGGYFIIVDKAQGKVWWYLCFLVLIGQVNIRYCLPLAQITILRCRGNHRVNTHDSERLWKDDGYPQILKGFRMPK